jgi:hypothetical protein
MHHSHAPIGLTISPLKQGRNELVAGGRVLFSDGG